jgi:hypothetical protein
MQRELFKKYKKMIANRQTHIWVPVNPLMPAGEMVQVPIERMNVCFAPGTDPSVVAAFSEAMNARQNGDQSYLDYNVTTRWSGTVGTTRTLTWSFVPDGLSISSGTGEPVANSDLFARMDSLFATAGGRATWVNLFNAFFTRWAQVSGLRYTRITTGGNDWDDGAAWGTGGAAGARGDLRISMKNIDGASGILAYNYFPSNGDMVIDRSENWASSANNYRFLRNTLIHEHGHGMGLPHVCPVTSSKLMEPFLATGFDGPQQDDIRAATHQYGDFYEAPASNGTAAAASNLGSLAVPQAATTFGNVPADATFPALPIPGSSAIMAIRTTDVDFYRFTTSATSNVTVVVTPVGSAYADYDQNADGSCQTGAVNMNAIAQGVLTGQIIAADGTTVLGNVTAAAAGSALTVTASGVPAGNFFVRVNSATSPASVQLYRFSVQTAVAAANQAPTLTIPSTLTVNELALASFTATATDPNAGQTLTYSITSGPAGASINPSSGAFTWTPTEAQGPVVQSVVIRVTDNGSPNLFDEKTVNITVNEVNVAPTLALINNQTVNELTPVTFTADGADTDLPAQTLTYSLISAPAGASINPSSGAFTWTPTEAQGPNSYTFTVRVSDGALTADRSVTITVNEVNVAPTLALINNQTVNELTPVTFTAAGADTDVPAQTLTYSLISAPAGASINPSSGAFTWTPTEAQGPNSYTFTVRVSDGSLTADRSVTITVNEANVAPTVTVTGSPFSVQDGGTTTFTAVGADSDLPAQTLSYSLSGAPAGASINPTSGAFTWSPTNAQIGPSYTFNVVVSDGVTTGSQSVTINTSISSKTLTGTINLEDITNPNGFVVEIRLTGLSGVTTLNATLNSAGAYSLPLTGLLQGSYEVAVVGPTWLRKATPGVTLASGSNTAPSVTLLNGDVDGDNQVSILDYLQLSTAYDTQVGDPGYDINADLDKDGFVSILDYLIVSRNYGLEGDN